MLIFAAACLVGIILLLPETYAPVILKKKAQRRRKAGDTQIWAQQERIDFSVSAGE